MLLTGVSAYLKSVVSLVLRLNTRGPVQNVVNGGFELSYSGIRASLAIDDIRCAISSNCLDAELPISVAESGSKRKMYPDASRLTHRSRNICQAKLDFDKESAMPVSVLLVILASVTMSAVAQILLKSGMSSFRIAQALETGRPGQIAVEVWTSPWILGGLGLYFLGACIWLFALAKVQVSQAYPFVGIGFIITLVLGKLLMGDDVTSVRVAGTIMVAVGVALIART